jgi:hypothetical protein
MIKAGLFEGNYFIQIDPHSSLILESIPFMLDSKVYSALHPKD